MVTYQPPSLTGSQGDPVTMPTHYSYDADKRLERVELPDGTGVAMRYHPAVGSCDALTPCTTGTCIQDARVDDDYQSVCGPTGFPPPAGHLIGVDAGPDGAIAYCYDRFARVSDAISPDAAVGFAR